MEKLVEAKMWKSKVMNFLHFFNIKKKRNLKLGFLVRKINLGGN